MKRKLALLITFLCLSLANSFAQSEVEIKNIQKKLENADDSIKIHLCKELYTGYFYTNLDKALEYAQKGYELAVNKNLNTEIADFSYKIGSVYLLQSKYSSALIYFLKTAKIAEELKDKALLADSYNKIGQTYLDQENHPKALEYFFNYLDLVGKSVPKGDLATVYNKIGLVYENQGIYKKALKYYNKALELDKQLGDYKQLSKDYANIGQVYSLRAHYNTSLKYFFKSLEILKKLEDHELTVSRLNKIGSVYEKLGKFYEALTYYFDALKIVENKNDNTGKTYCLHNIASTYSKVGEIENALDYELESYTIAKDIGSKEYIRITSLGLANIYAKLKNFEKAYEFHRVYTNYKDSLLTENSKAPVAESNVNYEAEKKEKEIELLRREQLLLKQKNEIQNLNLSKRNLLIYTLVVIIFLVFVLVIVLFNRILLKKRINNQLEMKVKERTSSLELAVNELFKTNNELDNFIYRSSHDLSGPLATLSGLCNVALLDVKDKAALGYFSRLKEVINKMSNLLYLIIDIGNIKHHTVEKSSIYLKEFVDKVIKSIGLEEKLKDINLKSEIPENCKIETDPKMLEIIVFNIIKNAIQYSIPAKSNHRPYIKIGFKEINNYWEISVADNGNGIPPEFSEKIFDMFFKGTSLSQGFGLGLYKSKNAIEKIGGEINLYNLSSNHKTLFIVSIPKKVKYPKPYFFFDFNFRNFKNKVSFSNSPVESVK
ncbi:MAG TPA: tetratricopeptide repeat-containing sensor histidine kinase [Cytophagales bacterium]|nr:tetratricopeptide repeat-containing sensor histidine kinase [Cytophagales bacterium]